MSESTKCADFQSSDMVKPTRLSYDIARCMVTHENHDCPLARYCLRRIDPGRPDYQSFTAFKGGRDCHGFIAAEGQAFDAYEEQKEPFSEYGHYGENNPPVGMSSPGDKDYEV